MGSQTVTSISLGKKEIGEERLKLWQERIAQRGYNSLSAFVVDLVDRDLGVKLPKPKSRQGPKPRLKK